MSLPKRTKHGNKIVKKIPKSVSKAFAIATYISTTLHDMEGYQDEELEVLHLRSNNAMKVFSAKVGHHQYWEISDKLGDIWVELAKRNDGEIKEESLPALVECMCMLIHPKNFKEFFGVAPYVRDRHIYFSDYANIALATLELDKALNDLLGTKSYVLQKPKAKVVKAKKKKERSKNKKPVKTKQKPQRVIKKLIEKKERKEENMKSLRERIAEAKRKRELHEC